MTEKMIEKISRAIAAQMNAEFIALGYPAADIVFDDWETADDGRKAAVDRITCAAIQAMQNLDDAYFQAAAGSVGSAEECQLIWKFLISAILQEGKE